MPQKLAGMKPQKYQEERPHDFFMRFHLKARAMEEPGFWPYGLLQILFVPIRFFVFRLKRGGLENIPASGPVIFAPNHGSFADHFLVGTNVSRKVRFGGKSQLFGGLMGKLVFGPGGVFPITRGTGSEEHFVTAEILLAKGKPVVWYPEGGRSRNGEIAPKAKSGIGRLALETGAPVVPVAISGSHQIRNWKHGKIPAIAVRFGEPIKFPVCLHSSREQKQEVADTVLAAIRELHVQAEADNCNRWYRRAWRYLSGLIG